MRVRSFAISLRFTATLSAALLAFAAVADNEATCPERAREECLATGSHRDEAPPTAPAQECAGRPCRTPVWVSQVVLAAQVIASVTTFVAGPLLPPLSAEPVAPATPPPLARR